MPESGFSRSVNKHNVDIIALADWIEASAAFLSESISKSDVIDVLCEEDVYNEQDFASERVDEAWSLLRSNAGSLAANALVNVGSRVVEPSNEWRACPATAFLLVLSLAPRFQNLKKRMEGDYTRQGTLFERVTRDAITAHGWQVHETGWQAGMQGENFVGLVDGVQGFLREPLRVVGTEDILKSANDAGLDLVCLWSYNDSRPAAPVLFLQCASGKNWRSKLKTPDPELWQKLIPFIVTPTRAISIPFLLDESSFNKAAILQSGVLIDRLRLLQGLGTPTDWLKNDVQAGLVEWLGPKLEAFDTAA